MHVYEFQEAGGPAVEIDVATPTPTGHEVLVRVTNSGVCHTDAHVQLGGYDLGSVGFMSLADRGAPFPIVGGHEIFGEVVAVGDEVTQVRVGDRRLVYPWVGCRTCDICLAGNENLCARGRPLGVFQRGGFAECVLVPHEDHLVDAGDIDPSWAATLACSGVTAYSAVAKARPADPDESVVVIGAGGVGLMAVAILKALGHRAIVVADVSDERLAIAQELGASTVVNTSVEEFTSNDLLQAAGGVLRAVIDFVNSGDTAQLAFNALSKNGVLVAVGLFGGDFALPTALVPIKGLTLHGSYVGNLAALRGVVELAMAGQLPRIPITERPLGSVGLNEALEGLAAGRVHGRIVLTA